MYKDIKAIKGKFYIRRLIDEGEHERQDFKFQISDARKIAHSISAFANNSGGRLLVGVKDNGVIAGIRSEEDIYMIEAAAKIYCRPAVEVVMTAFRCDGGAVVLRAEIPKAERRPVWCQSAAGRWQAYYRVADENILAPELMVKSWQRAESSTGGFISFSDAERALLRHIERNGAVGFEEYMLSAHLSRKVAEDVVTRLAASGIIKFCYSNPSFLLDLA